ncbi:MAG TPA: hypothetical protein VIG64_04100 [Actinomycetota bacterium]
MRDHFKKLAAFGAAALAVAVLAGPAAQAQNPMPANKTAAIGNVVDVLEPGANDVVLREELRVSSPADFIINLSSECAIVTQLITGATDGSGDAVSEANVEGKVEMWVTIDGKRVPVAGDPNGNGGDDGTVVFCNEGRGRRVTDDEDAADGQDEIADYNRNRTATAFQWLATNVGTAYDSPTNGNNVIEVLVHAAYTDADGTDCDALAEGGESSFTQTCSKAFVGKRTLIVEHTKASVIENTASSDGGS